jgi:hypothetical protein
MKKLLVIVVASASLFALPLTAMAQSNDTQAPATNMKGPPNANGFGKDQETGRSSSGGAASGTDLNSKGGPTSAKDLKGPPNANGYSK